MGEGSVCECRGCWSSHSECVCMMGGEASGSWVYLQCVYKCTGVSIMWLQSATDSDVLAVLVGRRCLHVRPGPPTMLECRFNKTTHHHPKEGLGYPDSISLYPATT